MKSKIFVKAALGVNPKLLKRMKDKEKACPPGRTRTSTHSLNENGPDAFLRSSSPPEALGKTRNSARLDRVYSKRHTYVGGVDAKLL